jgi:hypothetical protein
MALALALPARSFAVEPPHRSTHVAADLTVGFLIEAAAEGLQARSV